MKDIFVRSCLNFTLRFSLRWSANGHHVYWHLSLIVKEAASDWVMVSFICVPVTLASSVPGSTATLTG